MMRLIVLALVSLLGTVAQAQPYPARPVTLVVGYPAGGSVDLVARVVGGDLAKRLGQPVVVENVGGAGGTIGAAKVVNPPSDGHTLLMGSGSEVSIARLTNANVRYDGQRDLAPITLVGTQPMVLVGKAGLAAGSADELIRLAKAQPGKLNFASSEIGTPLHLAGEMINQQGGIAITHVPYKGAGPMVADLLGGQIDLAILVLSSGLSHIKSGKLKAIGITESKRSVAAPDIPALAETSILRGVDMGVWFGLFAPAKTPAIIIERLQKETAEALKFKEVSTKLTDSGLNIVNAGTAAFAQFIQVETDKYRNIVRTANIRVE